MDWPRGPTEPVTRSGSNLVLSVLTERKDFAHPFGFLADEP